MNTTQQLPHYQHRIQRIRYYVAAFLTLILLPLAAVVYYGYQQVEYEQYFNYRNAAENTVSQLNKRLSEQITLEQKRPATDYQFYTTVENPMTDQATQVFSPISNPDTYDQTKGLVGYFQIEQDGQVTSPILPKNTIKVSNKAILQRVEIAKRLKQLKQLQQLLTQSEMLNASQVALQGLESNDIPSEKFRVNIKLKDYLVFYRLAHINNQTVIQGFVVDKQSFLIERVKGYLSMTPFENTVQVILRQETQNEPCQYFFTYRINEQKKPTILVGKKGDKTLENKMFYRGILTTPFVNASLLFSTNKLPIGSTSVFIMIFIAVIIVVVTGGSFGFYWIGKKQIELVEQRMNFVSSVSHELKTPLTSILMYSEMLKNNMVSSTSVQTEYHEFIFDESERLSRLINNVLQLSKLNNHQDDIELNYISVQVIIDNIRSKISSIIDNNQFKLTTFIDVKGPNSACVLVDEDAMSQVAINLVDNSIKFFFSSNIDDANRREIQLHVSQDDDDYLKLVFRDFGPGINSEQENKIFELFYRGGDELTRTTSGTGIGLSLVHELMHAQQGKVQVKRHQQGVSFELLLKYKTSLTKNTSR